MLAVGPMVGVALKAAERLGAQGVSLRVVNARFLKPLDEHMLKELARRRLPIVTMEEGAAQGGFGSAVLEWLAAEGAYGLPIRIMGVPDVFVEHGSIEEQRTEAGLTAERLIEMLQGLLPAKKQTTEVES